MSTPNPPTIDKRAVGFFTQHPNSVIVCRKHGKRFQASMVPATDGSYECPFCKGGYLHGKFHLATSFKRFCQLIALIPVEEPMSYEINAARHELDLHMTNEKIYCPPLDEVRRQLAMDLVDDKYDQIKAMMAFRNIVASAAEDHKKQFPDFDLPITSDYVIAGHQRALMEEFEAGVSTGSYNNLLPLAYRKGMMSLIRQICPVCGSNQIEGGSIDIDSGGAYQNCYCNDCQEEWTDEYTLTGITEAE